MSASDKCFRGRVLHDEPFWKRCCRIGTANAAVFPSPFARSREGPGPEAAAVWFSWIGVGLYSLLYQ